MNFGWVELERALDNHIKGFGLDPVGNEGPKEFLT